MRIGITGGIGSGKSYICDIFHRKYKVPIFNSDKVAKEVMKEKDIRFKIIRTFGNDSFIGDNINIDKFNKLLFSSETNLKKMNEIIVPRVIEHYEFFNLHRKNTIIESAIIFNTDVYNHIDICILVETDMNFRMKQLKLRYNNDVDLIMKKISAQSYNPYLADYILKNDNTIEEQIDKLAEKINI